VKKMKEKTVEGCLISVRIIFKNYISPRGKVQPVGQFTERTKSCLISLRINITKEGEFGSIKLLTSEK
jgi:hypothetical protein